MTIAILVVSFCMAQCNGLKIDHEAQSKREVGQERETMEKCYQDTKLNCRGSGESIAIATANTMLDGCKINANTYCETNFPRRRKQTTCKEEMHRQCDNDYQTNLATAKEGEYFKCCKYSMEYCSMALEFIDRNSDEFVCEPAIITSKFCYDDGFCQIFDIQYNRCTAI